MPDALSFDRIDSEILPAQKQEHADGPPVTIKVNKVRSHVSEIEAAHFGTLDESPQTSLSAGIYGPGRKSLCENRPAWSLQNEQNAPHGWTVSQAKAEGGSYMLRRNRQRGFTLIELLIVVAIIGIIAAILIPNLIDALQKAKQKRTMSDIRSSGNAFMSWLTDQVGAASAGAAKKYDASLQQSKSYTTILSYLRPTDTFFYMQDVPQFDGWRNDIVFGLGTNVLLSTVISMYASCRDGSFETGVAPANAFTIYTFLATDYDQDIVWADGYFVRWPAGFGRN